MSAFNLLRSCGAGDMKPYIGFSKLKHGHHRIVHFKLVKNKMYNANNTNALKRVLLVELKDQVLFLPEYFARPFNDDEAKVNELNTDGVPKILYFGGKKAHSP